MFTIYNIQKHSIKLKVIMVSRSGYYSNHSLKIQNHAFQKKKVKKRHNH